MAMNAKDFTEGRRGYRDSDYAEMPKRKVYPTEAEAVASMASNEVAFRVYFSEKPARLNPFEVGVLAEYVVVERKKRGHPYAITNQTCLASCHADAIDKLGDDTDLRRVISRDEWWRTQSWQHLKAVGIR